MLRMLTKNWWLFALRGLFAVVFGVLAFIWPGMTIAALVLLFGAYAAADGLMSIITGFTDRNYRWWVGLLEGLVGLAAAAAAFLVPGLTALAFVYLVAAWAILTGIVEIIAAVRLRKEIKNEWFLALSGVASIIFGVVLVAFPGVGLLTLIWLVAGYAIVFGVMTIWLAIKLRRLRSADGETDPRTDVPGITPTPDST